jgi:predicted methyltransferase
MLITNIAAVQAAAAPATTELAIPAYVDKAVNNASRPQSDRDRDSDRLPADVITFAGIKPGDKIVDLMPGRGYFTRIFCAIAGDKGHVYAVTVPRKASPTGTSNQSATSNSSAASSAVPIVESCTNVTQLTLAAKNRPAPELHSDSDDPGWVYEYYQPSPAAENLAVPEPLDIIWTSENYHDLHNAAFGSPDMGRVTKAFFAALKPGGILIIEDHAATAKSGARDTQTFHRIDPELVKREVQSAGFVFVGESRVLHHPEDNHTTKAHDMHDKTDRFLLKFLRP